MPGCFRSSALGAAANHGPRVRGRFYPAPSHPTVRSDFPNTAVRQSSSNSMRSTSSWWFYPTAVDLNKTHRVQSLGGIFIETKSKALRAVTEIPTSAVVNELLHTAHHSRTVSVAMVFGPSKRGQFRIDDSGNLQALRIYGHHAADESIPIRFLERHHPLGDIA